MNKDYSHLPKIEIHDCSHLKDGYFAVYFRDFSPLLQHYFLGKGWLFGAKEMRGLVGVVQIFVENWEIALSFIWSLRYEAPDQEFTIVIGGDDQYVNPNPEPYRDTWIGLRDRYLEKGVTYHSSYWPLDY
jgi:hypothetical protein